MSLTNRLSIGSCGGLFLMTSVLVFGLCALTWADAIADQQKRLEAHYGLLRPESGGPFPAVMLVPDCAGFTSPLSKDHYKNMAEKLRAQGFVVIKVDSMSARGRGRCSEISPENISEDIVTAAKYLRAQSFVKATAINLMGWSSGGGFALDALSKGIPSSSAPVDAVVAYCPDYDYASPWKTDVPVLILLGGKDTIAPPAKIEGLLSKVPERKRVKLIVFPEAYHSFDNPGLPAETSGLYGTMGYNEKAATAAWEEVEKFLRR